MYFCASVCAGAGPCSTGVSPPTSLTFRCMPGASVLTAYLAQLICSAPRKPAPPVNGVTNGIVIVLLQLYAAVALAAWVGAPCAVVATITAVVARIARARPIAFFICVLLALGGKYISGGAALSASLSRNAVRVNDQISTGGLESPACVT